MPQLYKLMEQARSTELERKSIICILVVFDVNSKAYRLYEPNNNKIIISQDAKLNEDQVGYGDLLLNSKS